ncbi:MAG TPA: hypothetical protein ENN27_05150 [Candidatus Atribacteria bacterium]|nr:hypothetical protein [Candidatus Atribacteria bacterium]
MTEWTKETKSQSPHWKCEDITDRTVTRGKMENKSNTTRGAIAKYIFDNPSADVRRVDLENKYGSKNTIEWEEESK